MAFVKPELPFQSVVGVEIEVEIEVEVEVSSPPLTRNRPKLHSFPQIRLIQDSNVAIYFGKTTSSAALIETNVSHLPLTGTAPSLGHSHRRLALHHRSGCNDRAADPATSTRRTTRRGEPTSVRRVAKRLADAAAFAVAQSAAHHRQRGVRCPLHPRRDRYRGRRGLVQRVAIDDHRFAFVVGDVSGRGLAAATNMAGLRYTIRAYGSLGFSPTRILEMASREISIGSDGHFATVLVGLVDNERREVTMANAGHLPPLLLNGEQSEFVEVSVGVPLGVGAPTYESVTVPIAPNSTLIAYTDGLIKRRNESLDTGMERLRKAASVKAPQVEELLTSIVDEFFAEQIADDDTAILAIRWLH